MCCEHNLPMLTGYLNRIMLYIIMQFSEFLRADIIRIQAEIHQYIYTLRRRISAACQSVLETPQFQYRSRQLTCLQQWLTNLVVPSSRKIIKQQYLKLEFVTGYMSKFQQVHAEWYLCWRESRYLRFYRFSYLEFQQMNTVYILKYFGSLLTNQNSIQEEIKCRLKAGNSRYIQSKHCLLDLFLRI